MHVGIRPVEPTFISKVAILLRRSMLVTRRVSHPIILAVRYTRIVVLGRMMIVHVTWPVVIARLTGRQMHPMIVVHVHRLLVLAHQVIRRIWVVVRAVLLVRMMTVSTSTIGIEVVWIVSRMMVAVIRQGMSHFRLF